MSLNEDWQFDYFRDHFYSSVEDFVVVKSIKEGGYPMSINVKHRTDMIWLTQQDHLIIHVFNFLSLITITTSLSPSPICLMLGARWLWQVTTCYGPGPWLAAAHCRELGRSQSLGPSGRSRSHSPQLCSPGHLDICVISNKRINLLTSVRFWKIQVIIAVVHWSWLLFSRLNCGV